jgi:hypothetical protein
MFKWEQLEDTKGVIRSVKQRRTYNTQGKRKITKGKTTIHKTLYRKLMKELHEPH